MYIGLNAGSTSFKKVLKDGSCALLRDNLEIRSIAEERLTKIKAKGGYTKSLKTILKEESIRYSDIIKHKFFISSCCDTIANTKLETLVLSKLPKVVLPVSHHYSHALCSFSFSGFEKAIVAIWDCGGNYFSESKEQGSNNWWEHNRDQHSYFLITKNSVTPLFEDVEFNEPYQMGFGEIYRSLTYLLGFDSYIHSSKAMALAAFGNPDTFKNKRDIFSFDSSTGKITSDLKYGYLDNYKVLIKWVYDNFHIKIDLHKSGEFRDQILLDLAAFIQKQMEIVAIKKINYLIEKYGIKKICLGGGVGLNCVMNTLIRNHSDADDIYIPPASGDIGQSVGNAIYGYYSHTKKIPDLSSTPVYLGSDIRITEEILSEFNDYYVLKLTRKEKLHLAAYLINTNHIIGWCQGRSEWGPRALGNRSILCKAANLNLVEQLRTEIKFRNKFEPFAASVLIDDLHKYFNTNAEKLPYMVEVARPNPNFEKTMENCLHIDKTCRIQSVSKDQNNLFYQLLCEYKNFSGESIILNTSLNQRGKPICETAEDSFYFFVSSNLKAIFIGDFLLVKESFLYNEMLKQRKRISEPSVLLI